MFVPHRTGIVAPWELVENRASMQLVTIGVVDDSGWPMTKVSKSRRNWQIFAPNLQTFRTHGEA